MPENPPTPDTSKPNFGEIQTWQRYLETLHADRDAAIIETRRLRFQEKWAALPTALKRTSMEVRSNFVANHIERVTGVVTYNDPVATVPIRAETTAARDQSNKLEPFYNGLLRQLPRDAGRPIWDMGAAAQCGDGWSVYKVGYMPSKRARSMRRRKGESDDAYLVRTDEDYRTSGLPFWVRDLDPLTVLPFFGSYGLERVQEKSYKPAIELRRLYGNEMMGGAPALAGAGEDYQPVSAESSILVLEDWRKDSDRIWHTTVVKGQIVQQQAYNWPRLPYFLARGMPTNVRESHKEGMSVAHQMVGMQPHVDLLMSALLDYVIMLPYVGIEYGENAIGPNPNPDTNEPPNLKFTPGEAMQLPPGAKFAAPFQHLTGIGREFFQFLQLEIQMMNASGLSALFSGQSPGADTAGYTVNSLMNAGLTQIKRLVTEHTTAISECLQFIAWLIENVIKTPVYVLMETKNKDGRKLASWAKGTPADFDGYYIVEIQRDPLLPQNEISRGAFGNQNVAAGTISMRTNREEYHGIDQPETEERQRLLEKGQAMLEPLLMQQLQDRLVRRIAPPASPGVSQEAMEPGGEPTAPLGANGAQMPLTPPSPQRPTVGRLAGTMRPTGNPPREPLSLEGA